MRIARRNWLDSPKHPRDAPSVMALRRYTPPIRRLQEDYSAEIARRRMRALRGPRKPGPKIPDNSEPWIRNPRTVDELWQISQWVQERVDQIQSWPEPEPSSSS